LAITAVYTVAANSGIFAAKTVWKSSSAPFIAEQYFNPFDYKIIPSIKAYYALAPFYIYGALFFKSKHYVKTTLSIFLMTLLISFISAIVLKIVMNDWFNGWEMKQEFIKMISAAHDLGIYHKEMAGYERLNSWISEVFFTVITPIWLLITGYFRLNETEI